MLRRLPNVLMDHFEPTQRIQYGYHQLTPSFLRMPADAIGKKVIVAPTQSVTQTITNETTKTGSCHFFLFRFWTIFRRLRKCSLVNSAHMEMKSLLPITHVQSCTSFFLIRCVFFLPDFMQENLTIFSSFFCRLFYHAFAIAILEIVMQPLAEATNHTESSTFL